MTDTSLLTMGRIISASRRAAHLSIDQAARRLACKADDLVRWEQGYGLPSDFHAERLEQAVLKRWGVQFGDKEAADA